jgi:hypothetical protein
LLAREFLVGIKLERSTPLLMLLLIMIFRVNKLGRHCVALE